MAVKPKKKPLTKGALDRRKAKALVDYIHNDTLNEIAKKYKVTLAVVHGWHRSNGWAAEKARVNDKRLQEIEKSQKLYFKKREEKRHDFHNEIGRRVEMALGLLDRAISKKQKKNGTDVYLPRDDLTVTEVAQYTLGLVRMQKVIDRIYGPDYTPPESVIDGEMKAVEKEISIQVSEHFEGA